MLDANRWVAGLLLAVIGLAGCEQQAEIVGGPGVDLENRIVYVGVLNDESGPASTLGRPFALGNRLLVHQINTGQTDLLPEGWRVRLVERDHGYNPQRALQALEETHQRVAFYLSVFGTPNVVALQPRLEELGLVAFPTSNATVMANNRYTPPIFPSGRIEAMRSMDWAVEQRGGENLRVAVVYQDDNYGRDGHAGWMEAAEHHGVEVVLERGYPAGEQNFNDIAAELAEAEADIVFLATLPSATAPIVILTAQAGYRPLWLANGPAWLAAFLEPGRIPRAEWLFEDFYVATGAPIWGEDEPFVNDFIRAFEEYTEGRVPQDGYILTAYAYAQVPLQAFRVALENGDVSREGYFRAVQSVSEVDMDGFLPEPVDLTRFPYVPGTQTRVVKPAGPGGSIEVMGSFASPQALQ